jgi:hypothetical protein
MSDLQLITEAFAELNDDEQLDFFITYEHMFEEFITLERKEKLRLYYLNKYKTDSAFRERQSLRSKKYYKKKKENGEKKLGLYKDENGDWK